MASRTDVCQFWGLFKMRLLSVSRILVCVWQGEGVSKAVENAWFESCCSRSAPRRRRGSGTSWRGAPSTAKGTGGAVSGWFIGKVRRHGTHILELLGRDRCTLDVAKGGR